jgi:hypothetical protein
VKNYKRPVFGSIALIVLAASSTSALADGVSVVSGGDTKSTFIRGANWTDGTIEDKSSKVDLTLGGYTSTTGSNGATIKLNAEKNVFWGEPRGGNEFTEHGVSISPRFSGELQVRTNANGESKVEKYEARLGLFQPFLGLNKSSHTVAAPGVTPSGYVDAIHKTSSFAPVTVGGRLSRDTRTNTSLKGAEISLLNGTVDRVWETDKGNGIRVCGAFKPLTVLLGKHELNGEKSVTATELGDASLCLGAKLGEKGGEIRAVGRNVMRAHFIGKGTQFQDQVTGRLEYISPAISQRKMHVVVGAEATATYQNKDDNAADQRVIVSQGTVGFAL